MRGGLSFGAWCISWLVASVGLAQAPPPEPTVRWDDLVGPLPLRLRATMPPEQLDDDLGLYVRDPGDPWHFVCHLPCWATPMPGRWELAVARGEGDPVAIRGRSIELTADGILELRHSPRDALRVLAVGVAVVGALALASLWIALAVDGGAGTDDVASTFITIGYGIGFGAGGLLTVVGLILIAVAQPSASARWLPPPD